jgi:diguanylate cyclase (GGDEF)-like protein
MSSEGTVPFGSDGPQRSLRREWSRAFVVMLCLLLIAAVASIIGVRGLVDQVRGTARQLHRETSTVAVLSTAIVNHEEVGHLILSNEPANKAAYVKEQTRIAGLFAVATSVFPTTNGMRTTVTDAEQSWQDGLTRYGLWSTEVQNLRGSHAGDNPTYGASSDNTVAALAGLEAPALDAMNRGLDRAATLEAVLISLLVVLFAVAFGATVYYRRRMVKDLLRPVTNMHEGVLKLRGGEFGHRIAVARHDELGELAEAFNGMAGALHENHVALTLRATHDSLTGLPNRAALTDRLAAAFTPATNRRARQESVLFIDVDDFKEVNDSLGHEGGDTLLIQLAGRLQDCVRPQDMVARLGGDEFAIVVVDDLEGGVDVAAQVAERILSALHEPFAVNDTSLVVSVSIGAAHRRPDTTDAADLLRGADFAMYMAKGSGKDRYEIYDSQVHDTMVGRTALKAALGAAAGSDQLRLDYQPVVDLTTGRILGMEALVRWEHPTLGLLHPSDFISLAEETGDIAAIGCWVLETAIRQRNAWRAEFTSTADMWVAVNVSPFQLADPKNVAAIQQILGDPACDATHIVVEITETALTADIVGSSAVLTGFKELGVRIAVDDFGSGFSALSTLTNLPVDILKIDQSFVSGPAAFASSIPILESILDLAAKLSLDVIAEGIETVDQLQLLTDLGCKTGQGYLLSRPAAADQLQTLLTTGATVNLPRAQAAVISGI